MGRQPIPLTRSVYLHAYTGILSEIGVPLEQYLGKFNLPVSASEQLDSYVPLIPSLRFLQFAGLREGIDDLGFRATQRLEFYNLTDTILTAFRHQSTLNTVLQALCRFARLEDNCLHIWLERHGGDMRVCSTLLGVSGAIHFEYSHWLQNMMVVYIVRQFAGHRWTPRTIAFESGFSPGSYAREHLPNTRFLAGQPCSWIDLPVSLLGRTRAETSSDGEVDAGGTRPTPISSPADEDFVGSLKAMLPSYLCSGCPPIRTAAEIAGFSVRTLQRELASAGLSYLALIQQLRFQEAARLLRDGNAKVVDVAYAVGYEDPAHFTRAFRRLAGISPRQFRKTQDMS